MFAYFAEAMPHFLAYFAAAVGFAVAFLALYVLITPHKEFALIREGNSAAAVQLTGTFLGFAVPMAVVIGHSVNIPDMLLWGVGRGAGPGGGVLHHLAAVVQGDLAIGSPSAASPRASSSAGWGLASASSRPPAWSPERRYGRGFQR